eukprot:scaffold69306_cov27-Prasinocladus_malaysianus.AAC.1
MVFSAKLQQTQLHDIPLYLRGLQYTGNECRDHPYHGGVLGVDPRELRRPPVELLHLRADGPPEAAVRLLEHLSHR